MCADSEPYLLSVSERNHLQVSFLGTSLLHSFHFDFRAVVEHELAFCPFFLALPAAFELDTHGWTDDSQNADLARSEGWYCKNLSGIQFPQKDPTNSLGNLQNTLISNAHDLNMANFICETGLLDIIYPPSTELQPGTLSHINPKFKILPQPVFFRIRTATPLPTTSSTSEVVSTWAAKTH